MVIISAVGWRDNALIGLCFRNGEWGEPCSVEIELVCSNPWKLDYEISVHSGPVHGIDINSRLGLVASASWDRTCNLFDVKRKVTGKDGRGIESRSCPLFVCVFDGHCWL